MARALHRHLHAPSSKHIHPGIVGTHRNICQNVNVTSLEDVIKYFLQQAHAKAEQAQAQADVRDVCAC